MTEVGSSNAEVGKMEFDFGNYKTSYQHQLSTA